MKRIEYVVDKLTWSRFSTIEDAKNNEDYESFDYNSHNTYRSAVEEAKKLSTRIGQIILGQELASVRIVKAIDTSDDPEGYYEDLWHEYYKNGIKQSRITV